MVDKEKRGPTPASEWTFLSNHAHVLLCIGARAGDPPPRRRGAGGDHGAGGAANRRRPRSRSISGCAPGPAVVTVTRSTRSIRSGIRSRPTATSGPYWPWSLSRKPLRRNDRSGRRAARPRPSPHLRPPWRRKDRRRNRDRVSRPPPRSPIAAGSDADGGGDRGNAQPVAPRRSRRISLPGCLTRAHSCDMEYAIILSRS